MKAKNKKPSAIVNDIPLKYKFLFIYLLCILIPILTFNVLFYVQNTRNAETREEQNLEISMDRAVYDLMQIINECVAISNTVAADQSLSEMINAVYPDYESYYDAYNNVLRDKLRQYSNLHSYIHWLGIYTSNPTIQSGNSYFSLTDSDKRSEWYRRITESGDKVLLTSYVGKNSLYPNQNEIYVSLVRRLDRPGQAFNNYLRIDLQLGSVQELLDKERDYLQIQLVDKQNRVVLASEQTFSSSDKNVLLQPYRDNKEAGKEIVRSLGQASFIQGWKMVAAPEQRASDHQLKRVVRFALILALVTTIIPTVLTVIILRSYNLRVRLLYKHMKLVKFEQFEKIHMYEGRDEIGGLIRSFNLMAEKMRNLINDVYKLEIQKKDLELERVRAELNDLQSQVDPHFLFNTLNAILVICKRNGYDQVTDVIKNMALILRRLLGRKGDLVTVEDEISFIEMYLQIEKFRFQERFTYRIDVDPAALACLIPKMSIQALVENACKHGLQTVKGARVIHVSVSVNPKWLTIMVTDNGTGMDQAKLEWIERHLHSEEGSGKNIGLRNVYKRLKLCYEAKAKFTIESIENEHTRITIHIPTELAQAPRMGEFYV
ncbi:sensor histidine kinase [Paenibacillus sp. CN-4]|uniref:sensor histidine kinase n=1 Tax=Paenibacillus nanchangensis TaxID=3348343 RepID=UPI0039795191